MEPSPYSNHWQAANRYFILDEVGRIRSILEESDELPDIPYDALSTGEPLPPFQFEKLRQNQFAMDDGEDMDTGTEEPEEPSFMPALLRMSRIFNLSSFEVDVLLLCAGMELDGEFPGLCAAIHGNQNMNYPTFQLALHLLHSPHWSSLSSGSAIRYWQLLEVGGGPELTRSPLRLDEKILHYMLGINHIDQRLLPYMEPLISVEELAPSQAEAAHDIAAFWSSYQGPIPPVFFLWGDQVEAKRAAAVEAAQMLGREIRIMAGHLLPTTPDELNKVIRLWEREYIMTGTILLLDCDRVSGNSAGTVDELNRAINHVIDCMKGMVIMTGRERRRPPRRPFLGFDVDKPNSLEQRNIWNRFLGQLAEHLEPWVERLVYQFNLGPSAIRSICLASASDENLAQDMEKNGTEALGKLLWQKCRVQARPRLEDMVRPIDSKAGWDDLVLPDKQVAVLRDIARHVRHRGKVYETWGFASKGDRGLGISALFAGLSGTGKTMAAEVLAKELDLDLYRVDLSTVINKYIGETEKNLRRVFDTGEEAGAVLLFDEADAIFGKRSDVKDSHDRYANVGVSYLLQRMEDYHGLAILTTNLKEVLDKAFIRRLRFIVHFPFPNPAERAKIWEKIFPKGLPKSGLNYRKLAQLNVSGGNIRNIALNAAFRAADDDSPVSMEHLLKAARSEYMKLEKVLTEEEIKGWV